MTIKLTEKFYVDDESIQTMQFHEKGDTVCSPTLLHSRETVPESILDASFKRRPPIRLVGAEADEAWANWKAHADNRKQ